MTPTALSGRLIPDGCVAVPVDLLDALTDPDDCYYDHHGYCQAHGYFEIDPPCCHARAKAILVAARGEEKSK